MPNKYSSHVTKFFDKLKTKGEIKINVLSLFDGLSCGQIALERAGIKVDSYFASEIDKYAIQVTQKNYPNTIQLGNVLNHQEWQLPKIDLLIGGSPCQDISRIKSIDGKGLAGEKSKLFYEFVDCIKQFKPKYFLLENVIMNKKDEDIITDMLQVEPREINSSHFSAQDRRRLYWTNIPLTAALPDSSQVLRDILEDNVEDKYYYDDKLYINDLNKRVVGSLHRYYPNGKVKMTEMTSRVYNPDFKAPTLTAVTGGHQEKKVYIEGKVRKLTPLEYERLQTVKDNYTASVSNSQRYKMLGNGWTVDVIAYIFKHISVKDKLIHNDTYNDENIPYKKAE